MRPADVGRTRGTSGLTLDVPAPQCVRARLSDGGTGANLVTNLERIPNQALNGMLLIGWTASYTYLSMERLWDNDKESR